jgi:serine/threonine protein kinase
MSSSPDDAETAPAHEGAEESETTVFHSQGPDRGMDATIPLSRLLEKHSIETRVDLSPALPEEGKSLLPSTARDGRRYEMVEQLAKGGMGIVLRSNDSDLRRQVAMKVIVPDKRRHRETMVRFVEEAQITGQLEHPNIIPVHELGVDGQENLFYTMKLIQGHTLKEILDGLRAGRGDIVKKYGLSQLLNIFLKACDAVAFAHSKGVVHRDLKPHNIMIGDFGEVIVLDWGIAKILPPDHKEKRKYEDRSSDDRTMKSIRKVLAHRGALQRRMKASAETGQSGSVDSIRTTKDKQTTKTMAGQIMGSPGFMAPEQAHGDVEEIDQRTDIYSLGAILFNILSLHQHVEGDSVQDILEAMISGRNESPVELIRRKAGEGKVVKLPHCPAGRIPPALSDITMKALETRKRNRYQEVEHLQKDVLAYMGGYATTAETGSPARKCLLFVRRHKVVSIVMFAAVLLALGAVYPMVRAMLDMDSRLVAAEHRVDDLTCERLELLDELGELKEPGLKARAAADELVRLMEEWQWEKADRQAGRLMKDGGDSTLLLPPGQLMSMAQLRLFHGDIEGALPLLRLLRGSEPGGASKALIGALTTDDREPVSMPARAAGAMELHAKLCELDHAEARLAADCLVAGTLRSLVRAGQSGADDAREEAFNLAIEWMRNSSGQPDATRIDRSGGEGASLAVSQTREGPIRLEVLRWLPVEHLDLSGCPGLDVSALREMSGLKTLRVAETAKGLDELRELKLERIGCDELLPPAEFWSRRAGESEDR